jgi:hypothetical protein
MSGGDVVLLVAACCGSVVYGVWLGIAIRKRYGQPWRHK